MSYTTPPTFVAAAVLAASELNVLGADIEDLNGRLVGLTFSGCQVTRSGTQAISSSTDTLISFNVENFDYGAWFTSGTTITVPAGAIPSGFTTIAVDLTAQIRFATNATGNRTCVLLQNGAEVGSWTLGGLSGDPTTIIVPETAVVAAGDTLQVQVWQNSGGVLNITRAKFTVERRAPVA